MIAWASQWHCEDVQPYYYDYLQAQEQPEIPAGIMAHIDSCGYCQGQIDELEQLLHEAPAISSTGRDEAWLEMIQLHFKLAEQPITKEIDSG